MIFDHRFSSYYAYSKNMTKKVDKLLHNYRYRFQTVNKRD